MTIWRMSRVMEESGNGRTTIYDAVKAGRFVRPVKLGIRAIGFPAEEVQALNAARIAGKSDEEIKALVRHLEAERRAAT